MKKLIFALLLFFSLNAKAENLDSTNVTFTVSDSVACYVIGSIGEDTKLLIVLVKASMQDATPNDGMLTVTISERHTIAIYKALAQQSEGIAGEINEGLKSQLLPFLMDANRPEFRNEILSLQARYEADRQAIISKGCILIQQTKQWIDE